MTAEKLTAILALHKQFLNDEDGVLRADLRRADLRHADLRHADLSGADLRYADLSGADLQLQIEEGLLQKVAIAALAKPENLEMRDWHSCETTHCISGWATHISPNGKEFEKKYGYQIAGLMLLGVEAHSHFFDDNEDGRAYLQSVLDKANVTPV